MLFNSVAFVLFALVVYSIYSVLKHRPQNIFLLIASYFFYGCWDWRFLALIFVTTLVDFLCSGKIYSVGSGTRQAKVFVLISLCVNLGILGFFKYFNFFEDSAIRLLSLLGMEANGVTLKIILPVGISFYTFQSLSYTIDVYRGKLKPTRNFFDYALFVSFFPQLVAGPIERATHLLPQVENPRTVTYHNIREGAWLILLGYFKKVVIADNFADIATVVFNNPGDYHGLAVLIGVYAFAFQIYGDFSGYSDIARGLAKLMGFDLMLNFRMPYFATNPQDFWRRWHISLSTWLRDYLYISLGGNKGKLYKTYRNLFLTMLLGGLWHGAAWNFVLWGAFHGTLLIAHRRFVGESKGKIDDTLDVRLFKMFVMFHLTCFGWILFRINNLSDLSTLVQNLLVWGGAPSHWLLAMPLLLWPLFILHYLQERANDMLVIKEMNVVFRWAAYSVMLSYIMFLGKVDGYDFIYFQF
ncbi:MAG TPA: MBOAT family protein [Candidatus Hydrogenedentes bacterium]|nr:MBOAT family protein [Candidatus Hydrogenedentota bacterium]